MINLKWDHRFLNLAQHIALWSKDPSTQVGCVIADDSRRVVALGYNGFPKGIEDTADRLNDRPTKYKHMVHAELSAVANANIAVRGCTVYVSLAPCAECMKLLITHGIKRVVAPAPSKEILERWGESMKLGEAMAAEVHMVVVKL